MALVSRLEQLRSVGHRAKGLVSIVGNIAAGKSTVLEQLSRVVAVEPEPLDIWWPFLEDMRVSVSIYTCIGCVSLFGGTLNCVFRRVCASLDKQSVLT